MRTLLLMLSLSLVSLTTSGCGSTPVASPTDTTPSKGKRISDCMDRSSPEDCDRQINRRSRDY